MSQEVYAAVHAMSLQLAIDPYLAIAITAVESGGNQYATRFEPAWKYFLDVEKFAVMTGISAATEQVHQATSWGPMQIMGSVARELGFVQPIPQLTDPNLGAKYAILHLKKFLDLYKDEQKAISAYNAGSPRLSADGSFVNQAYIDKVCARLGKIRAISNASLT